MRLTSDMSVSDITKELGPRLREIRINENMTQQQLGTLAGLPSITISRMERGEIKSLANLLAVLRAFHLIEKIELVLPEIQYRPSQAVHNKNLRQRVRKSESDTKEIIWKWGDES